MSTNETISVDLWKFFEERGAKLKESMSVLLPGSSGSRSCTWVCGKRGFDKGLIESHVPRMVISLAVSGLLLLTLRVIVLRDYGIT